MPAGMSEGIHGERGALLRSEDRRGLFGPIELHGVACGVRKRIRSLLLLRPVGGGREGGEGERCGARGRRRHLPCRMAARVRQGVHGLQGLAEAAHLRTNRRVGVRPPTGRRVGLRLGARSSCATTQPSACAGSRPLTGLLARKSTNLVRQGGGSATGRCERTGQETRAGASGGAYNADGGRQQQA